MEAREKAPLEDNSYMFKKLAHLHLPTYDGAANQRPLRIGFGHERCLMPYNASRNGG